MTLLVPLPRVEGGWKAIMADPPWFFRSYAPPRREMVGSDRSIERHYDTMKLDDIKAMPVRDIAAPDCHLFLWSTGPHLPQAFEVMKEWGFRYSGIGFTWAKLRSAINLDQLCLLRNLDDEFHMGLGHTTRANAEFCLLGRRGNARRLSKNVRELIVAPVREHSRKPDESYERAERYCDGPYLEIFGRQSRPGWTVWGNEATKFDEAAE